jgi:hypothetical protein
MVLPVALALGQAVGLGRMEAAASHHRLCPPVSCCYPVRLSLCLPPLPPRALVIDLPLHGVRIDLLRVKPNGRLGP